MLCKISSQDIAEIPCGDRHVDPLSVSDLSLVKKPAVSIDIVGHLGDQSADIDGIGGREDKAFFCQLLCKFPVCKNLFYSCLGIVEIAVDSHNCRVIPLLSHHLKFLDPADSVFGIKHDDPGPRHVGKACHGRLPRVA